MSKPISLFLLVVILAMATTACELGPTPTEVATEAPTAAPTEAPTATPTEAPTATPTEEPTPSAGETWTRPADRMVMVYVPAGEFRMGSDDDDIGYALRMCDEYRSSYVREWFEDEQPMHTVALASFWIDQTEVTNGQYRRCVRVGACAPPDARPYSYDTHYGDDTYDDDPVVWVTWHQAAVYCKWAGARLPTEAEWEYAARGTEGLAFPWGDEFDGMQLNYCDVNCGRDWADETIDDGYAATAPVGSYPGGASWCGALDMAGNVGEWVADWYGYYRSSRRVNPTGPFDGVARVHRGGSWYDPRYYARGAARSGFHPAVTSDGRGFRCSKDSEYRQ